MVDEQLLSLFIAGEAADAVVDGYYIRIKAADEIIEAFQRCYLSAGRNIYIDSERCDRVVRMEFGVGMDGKVALVKMSDDILLLVAPDAPEIAGIVDLVLIEVLFGYEQCG